ncbi:GntR family transcriptional regulator [Azoarcus sp. KH32C]|uniref:GntR family transcriptional regulator n=1 Tax=Azoarcus sp. KH32C TaxID=748247 RepID=UPI000238612E|nr:GntR family transcriptional regulator [Azoarcus sp. KH32C]BAL24056.1 transcriptional regulator, GntR family [Azoarcus sp. KH32C]
MRKKAGKQDEPVAQAGDDPTQPADATSSDQEIYERIVTAIMEHRLPPGTKLGEDKLAKIFGASRARVRQVLARLALERIVVLHPNRGAFIAEPTVEEAREVFEVRQPLEALVVRRVIDKADPRIIARLREHVQAEEDARAARDRRAIIRLSGEYHVLLAELSGSTLAARLMHELASLTCLIIFLYDAPSVPACRDQEHAEITQALADGNEAEAIRLMAEHLEHVEACLDLKRARPEELDLEAALAG